jgi:hypothetical protein
MKTLLLLLVAASCASGPQPILTPPESEREMVTVETTLEHIFQSYVLGCVEALKKEGKKGVYPLCQQRGQRHAEAVKRMLAPEPKP